MASTPGPFALRFVTHRHIAAAHVDDPRRRRQGARAGRAHGGRRSVQRPEDHADRVRLLRLSRPFGVDIALTAGLESAIGDVVVTMLAECDPPALIPQLVEAVERAILKSSPLPKPDRPELFARNLTASKALVTLTGDARVHQAPLTGGEPRLVGLLPGEDRRLLDPLVELIGIEVPDEVGPPCEQLRHLGRRIGHEAPEFREPRGILA